MVPLSVRVSVCVSGVGEARGVAAEVVEVVTVELSAGGCGVSSTRLLRVSSSGPGRMGIVGGEPGGNPVGGLSPNDGVLAGEKGVGSGICWGLEEGDSVINVGCFVSSGSLSLSSVSLGGDTLPSLYFKDGRQSDIKKGCLRKGIFALGSP